jgi:hypothetical protein
MINNYETKQLLRRIYKYQGKIKELVNHVEACSGLTEISDDDGWTWGMVVDQQGEFRTPEENFALLEKFKRMLYIEERKGEIE